MENEIIDAAPKSAVAAYVPFYAELTALESQNAATVFDYESKAGNKDARSHVFALRKTKGALERVRKEAKAESLRVGKAIDSEAADIEARIEAMIEVHQAKLDEIEQREKDRLRVIAERLSAIVMHCANAASQTELAEAIATLEPVMIGDEFGESAEEALRAKDMRLIRLRADLAARIKADHEAAELARLRAESEALAQKDREDAIAKAAADRATAEAAAKAQEDAAKAAKAIADAKAQAQAEIDAAARRELQLKLDAEMAERRRVEGEQEAERQRVAALAKADADKARAIQAEKDRVAAIAKREADELARREADTKHKGAVNRKALEAMIAGGIAEDCAKACIKLIAQGKIAGVRIEY